MKKAIRIILFTIIFLATIIMLPAYQTVSSSRELQVKAAFLFNFSQFTDWPAAVFPDPKSPMVIGILGNDPFGIYLEQITFNEKIDNHPLIIQHYRTIEEMKACHILFVNVSDKEQLNHVFETVKGRNILTVGESRNFIRQGGMIRFVTENDKIKFQINAEAAKAENLSISSRLLRLAEIVTSKSN